MKWKLAAVLEPNAKKWKALADGLKKAGLKVSAATEASQLGKEQLVVMGPSAKSPTRFARDIRQALPQAFVMAAQAKGFKAAYADAVLPMPVSPNDLRVRLHELSNRDTNEPLPRSSTGDGILDPVTNFYTFAHFKEVLFIEVKRARRYGFPLALACVGLDGAEGMNADLRTQLMSGVSLAMRRSLRDTDYPVQYSAERVLLLMPHTDLAGSLIVARRICERVSKATLQYGDEMVQPTISVGVAAGDPGKDLGFSDLVKQAQDGLTQAFAGGGNRVEFFDIAQAKGSDVVPPAIPPMPPGVD